MFKNRRARWGIDSPAAWGAAALVSLRARNHVAPTVATFNALITGCERSAAWQQARWHTECAGVAVSTVSWRCRPGRHRATSTQNWDSPAKADRDRVVVNSRCWRKHYALRPSGPGRARCVCCWLVTAAAGAGRGCVGEPAW